MTRRATGPGGGIPRIWLVPIAFLTALLAVAASGALSRSLVLDLVSWWPVWLAMAVATYLARGRRLGKVRLAGVVPLLATAAVALLAIGHLRGWEAMPSGSYRLVGPVLGAVDEATLSARVDGELRVSAASSGFLYRVEPIRRGGDIALPEAVERSTDTTTAIVLGVPPEPGFYGFAGWDVTLAVGPEWVVALEGEVDADLRGVHLSSAELSGTGRIVVGPVETETRLMLNGDFVLEVDPGTSVRVVGAADTPETWERLLDGWKSPSAGFGWVVETSESSSLVVTEG